MTASRLFVGICLWILASYLVNPSGEFMRDVSIAVLLRAVTFTCLDLAAKGYPK